MAAGNIAAPVTAGTDHIGHLQQGLIAGGVAGAVVEGLEMVDVDQRDAERFMRAGRAAPLDAQLLLEIAAVEHVGQRVAHTQ